MEMTTAISAVGSEAVLPVGPSSKLSIIQELWAPVDFGLLFLSPEFWGRGIPQGNGAPAIVVPGFGGSRAYFLYQVVDFWLSRIGYRPRSCGFGLNTGCPNDSTQKLCAKIDEVASESGMRVHLLGHSLGAALVRSAAKQRPDKVASVTSVAGTIRGAMVHPLVYSLAQFTLPAKCMEDCHCKFHSLLEDEMPPDIPRMALFTRSDGIIEAWNCEEDPGGDSIEIMGSTHISLMANRDSYQVIAHFLNKHRAK